MRPYQLEPDGEWVDLDTIQVIYPPVFVTRPHGGTFSQVCLRWRHAFQNQATESWWEQRYGEWKKGGRGRELEAKHVVGDYGPFIDENDVPTELARVRRDVYEPFLAEWKKGPVLEQFRKDLMEKKPIPIGPDT